MFQWVDSRNQVGIPGTAAGRRLGITGSHQVAIYSVGSRVALLGTTVYVSVFIPGSTATVGG